MTTNLLQLAETVTKDTEDTIVQEYIRANENEIRKALEEGRECVLQVPNGAKIVIRAKRTLARGA